SACRTPKSPPSSAARQTPHAEQRPTAWPRCAHDSPTQKATDMTTTDMTTTAPIPDVADENRDLASLRASLVERAAASDLLDVAYRFIDSPLGRLLLAATPRGLVRLAFEGEPVDDVLTEL